MTEERLREAERGRWALETEEEKGASIVPGIEETLALVIFGEEVGEEEGALVGFGSPGGGA